MNVFRTASQSSPDISAVNGEVLRRIRINQPPSGGCVLKQQNDGKKKIQARPAAFGRLCVETFSISKTFIKIKPAAFGRLCVETIIRRALAVHAASPAAFGRLCVETMHAMGRGPSKHPAAFGRLCVETEFTVHSYSDYYVQPPSGGCVLKLSLLCIVTLIITSSRLRAAVC